MSPLTPEIQARIDELKALPWQQIKKAASEVGITREEGEQWDDIAERIAIAEFSKEPASLDNQDLEVVEEPVEVKSAASIPEYYTILGIDYPEEFQSIQGNYCPNCRDKVRTDLVGNPYCPASDLRCPRSSK